MEFRKPKAWLSSGLFLPFRVTLFHKNIASGPSAAALLIFFTAAAGAGIVGINLCIFPSGRHPRPAVVLIGTGNLGDLFSLHLLFQLDTQQQADSVFLDILLFIFPY